MPDSKAPFSQVVLDQDYAHLAGIVAADFAEGQKVLGNVAAETDAILTIIKIVLSELELEMSQIVRVDVHLCDLDDFDAMDSAYRKHFVEGRFPARTTTQSSKLFGKSKVEITCMVKR